MKKRLIFLMLLCLFVFCSCSSNKDKNNENKDTTKQENDTDEDSNKSNLAEKMDYSDEVTEDGQAVFDELFNLDNFVSVKIDISDEELGKIESDYEKYESKHAKSPIYRCADKVTFTVGDKSYEVEDVGVRMKGNTSRTEFYSTDKGVYNIINLKLSFDETFDNELYYGDDVKVWENEEEREARKNRTFALMGSVNLKFNVSYDPTHMAEYYIMAMYRDFDVLAAHNTPSVVNVNDKNWGIMTLFEPVDKYFLDKTLDTKDMDGDLYKCSWAGRDPASYELGSTYGITDADSGVEYSYDLKTNKKTSQNESIMNLLDVLNDSELNKKSFASVMDTDYFTRFTAVSYFAGSPDDAMYNYNNHYLYFLKDSGKAVMIPYDYDIAFGVCTNWNPYGDCMTKVDPFFVTKLESENIRRQQWQTQGQRNPMFKFGLNDDFYKDEYLESLKNVAESKWMDSSTYEEYYNKVKANYEQYMMPDINFANVDETKYTFEFDYGQKGNNKSPVMYIKEKLETYNNSVK